MRFRTQLLLIAGLSFAMAGPAQELEKRAWDPSSVRVATQDLQAISASLTASLDRKGTGNGALRSELDRFTQEVAALREAIESGKSRNEVRPLYKQLRMARLALADKARLASVTVTQAEIEAFQAVFSELESYFRQ